MKVERLPVSWNSSIGAASESWLLLSRETRRYRSNLCTDHRGTELSRPRRPKFPRDSPGSPSGPVPRCPSPSLAVPHRPSLSLAVPGDSLAFPVLLGQSVQHEERRTDRRTRRGDDTAGDRRCRLDCDGARDVEGLSRAAGTAPTTRTARRRPGKTPSDARAGPP